MTLTRAWILNLDADDELGANTPKQSALVALDAMREELARTLLVGTDVLVDAETSSPLDGNHLQGWAWCATPKARARFKSLDISLVASPSVAVLRRVLRRDFAPLVGADNPGRCYVRSLAELKTLMDSKATKDTETRSSVANWRLSRMHTASGRGHRIADNFQPIERWAARVLQHDGCVELAPWVEITQEFALHGWLDREQRCTLGEPTTQNVERAQWLSSRRANRDELSADEHMALTEAARQAGAALLRAGYWGAFGVDAFRYLDASGTSQFCALGELNARFTMGWAIGMGDRRPDYSTR